MRCSGSSRNFNYSIGEIQEAYTKMIEIYPLEKALDVVAKKSPMVGCTESGYIRMNCACNTDNISKWKKSSEDK